MRHSNKHKVIFHLVDGTTITCMPGDYRAVMDRRGDFEEPQRVWEILVAGHVMRQLWPEQIDSWEMEPII